MDRDGEHRSKEPEHGRRWRRDPFAPASFHRPGGGRGEGSGDREPRDPRPRGGEAADSERPPSS